jgi:hypothetical protein
MSFQTHKITSVSDLLGLLSKLHKGGKSMASIWFRGHSDHRWHLEPSLARKGKLDKELQLIKQFKQNAYQFLDHSPLQEADWIFLMQHYGVPTRLLDWTENPLVALYFALLDEQNPAKKGKRKVAAAVWCLYPRKLNEISGLILNPPDDIPAFGDDQELDDYLPSRVHAQGISRKSPVAITAARKFSRVYAQAGVFTILHRDGIRIDELKDKQGRQDHLVKLLVPRSTIATLRKEIRDLGIHKLSIFPQLENVAERVLQGL